jgi:UDP-3-O-[3-hydroxymyristoyl] glucosamine N-acyltransferase
MKAINIVNFINTTKLVKGNINRTITKPGSIKNAKVGDLIFCIKENEISLKDITSCTVICASFPKDNINNTYIIVKNPKLWFAKVVDRFFNPRKTNNIHKTVVLEGNIEIGKNVFIQAYCTIGTEGFGHVLDENGKWIHFPQIGGVTIENDVEIATGTNIHRGTLDNTIIQKGTKISTHCNIGHNSIIGKHTFIGGNTNLGGKTEIGDHCFIGMRVVTKPGIKIGNNTTIGMGSVVIKDIGDNCIAYGNPAKVIS